MPSWFKRDLGPGDSGPDVEIVQRRLHAPETETYGTVTETYVRGLQRLKGLPITGEVDEATAEAIGETARAGLPPLWYHRVLRLGVTGADVQSLRQALGLSVGEEYDTEVDRAVRRLQSRLGLKPDGVMTQELSLCL